MGPNDSNNSGRLFEFSKSADHNSLNKKSHTDTTRRKGNN